MYGLVNEALRELVVSEHGAAKWAEIVAKSGVGESRFVAMKPYEDRITYALVGAASEVLGAPAAVLLERFGEHWVLHTAQRGYGPLLDACGRTFEEFLENIDLLHSRMKLAMPELDPPSFQVATERPGVLRVRYQSHRAGLGPMVAGLLKGLALRYRVTIDVDHVVRRADGDAPADEFLVAVSPARTEVPPKPAEAAA